MTICKADIAQAERERRIQVALEVIKNGGTRKDAAEILSITESQLEGTLKRSGISILRLRKQLGIDIHSSPDLEKIYKSAIALIATGSTVVEAAREIGIESSAMHSYMWRKKIKVSDVRKIKHHRATHTDGKYFGVHTLSKVEADILKHGSPKKAFEAEKYEGTYMKFISWIGDARAKNDLAVDDDEKQRSFNMHVACRPWFGGSFNDVCK